MRTAYLLLPCLALAPVALAQAPAAPSAIDYIYDKGRKIQLTQVEDAAFYRIQSLAKLAKDPAIRQSLDRTFGMISAHSGLEEFAVRKTAELTGLARQAIARLTRTSEATALRAFTVGNSKTLLIEYPEIILQCEPGTTLEQVRQYMAPRYQVTVVPTGLRPGQFLVRVNTASHTLWLANQLKSTSKGLSVRYADVNFWFAQPSGKSTPAFPHQWPGPAGPGFPDDPAFAAQWALRNTGPTLAMAKAVKGADIGFAGAFKIAVPDATGVKVAVLDYAIDVGHPELEGVIDSRFNATRYDPRKGMQDPALRELDFLEQPESEADHGTACAGVIAALTSNKLGISGIAPGAKIVAIQIATPGPEDVKIVSGLTLIAALQAARTAGARVVSLSWGISFPDSNAYQSVRDEINDMNQAADGLGILLVAAAGNDVDGIFNPDFPADYSSTAPNVLSAGASDWCGGVKRSGVCDSEPWNSRFNQHTLFAPGVAIFTLTNRRDKSVPNALHNYRMNFSGTSAATPIVAGAAALVMKQHPDWNVARVRQRLLESAKLKSGGKLALDICNALHGADACPQ